MLRSMLLLGGVVFLVFGSSASWADNPCPGKIPSYVLIGGDGMVLTAEAEETLCRNVLKLPTWDGRMESGRAVVEDRIVTGEAIRRALASRDTVAIEFRRCAFTEEVYLKGAVRAPLVFRECEFQGNVDFRAGEFERIEFVSSVFHQNLFLGEITVAQPLSITGSVLTGLLEIDRSLLQGGLRISGSRLSGRVHVSGFRSPVGVNFDSDRFLGSMSFAEPEMLGGIRFRDSEWDRSAVIDFSGGTIGAGIRFDSCGFDATWVKRDIRDVPLIRLSDVTVGSAVVLANVGSKQFPHLRVSRCVIPFIKLPEWNIARHMVGRSGALGDTEKEDLAELMQLVRASYDIEGRTRDANSVRAEHDLLIAEITGGMPLVIKRARVLFGTGLWWLIGVVSCFALVLFLGGRRWKIFLPRERLIERFYKAYDLSIRGIFKGPPEEEEEVQLKRIDATAKRILMVERVIGILFFFLLGLLLDEWIKG